MSKTNINQSNKINLRRLEKFETRADETSGELFVEGVAAVYNSPTVLLRVGEIDYKEQIATSAFDGADMSDVIFNYNHGGKVVARTRNKTLDLWLEMDGLHIRARLDGTEEGKKLYEEIRGGYIDKMSFAFSVEESSYDVETHTRTVQKVKKVYDVSAVDIPAYDETSINSRSNFTAIAEFKEIEANERQQKVNEIRKNILANEIKYKLSNI